MLYDMVVNPNSNDSVMMRANSPVFNIDKTKAVLFVAQGANDRRVAQAESDQMPEALEKNGLLVQYMLKKRRSRLRK
ncbi:MAG: dipeptidyl aminopeptidase/acylaminoacyl peptidase [Ulvibacter sp.]|jgi:dipeptidyl aminopeptidase/acylaminoacyl peptidase